MTLEMNETKLSLKDQFFTFVDYIRNDDLYKNLDKSSSVTSENSKEQLMEAMNVEKEEQNLKSLIDLKQEALQWNKLSEASVLLDLNAKANELLGITDYSIIDFPNERAATKCQFTINVQQLRNILRKERQEDIDGKINSFVENIQVYLKENNIFLEDSLEIIENAKFKTTDYMNFDLSDDYSNKLLEYTYNVINDGVALWDISWQNIIIDYSSPNVAKQMTIWHLRSTLIGEVFKNLFEKKWQASVLGFNHLWDWGEQFGKFFFTLIYASDEQIDTFKSEFEKNPNKALFDIYVWFKNFEWLFEDSKKKVKDLFAQLNRWDKNLIWIWNIIREVSMQDFQKVYDRLWVSFESRLWEAFYEVFMDDILVDLEDKWFLVKDEDGEKVYILKVTKKERKLLTVAELENVEVNEETGNITLDGKWVFQKVLRNNVGVTNYLTRDIAALKFRREHLWIDYIMYLTGEEQKDHFAILELIGKGVWYLWEDTFVHLPFGLYKKEGKKMSSRDGNVNKLSDVFDLVDAESNDEVLSNASILINDLKQQINKSVEFDIDKIIDPIGNTWIYLLYTAVRWKKILNDNNYVFSKDHLDLENVQDGYKELVGKLFRYGSILEDAIKSKKLHLVITYAFDIARSLSYLYTAWENIGALEEGKKKDTIYRSRYFWINS